MPAERDTGIALCLAFYGLALFVTPALCLGPTDPFDAGLSDWEIFIGYAGIGLDRSGSGVSSELLMGAGLTPWLSGSFTVAVEADAYLGSVSETASIGLFGVVIGRERFSWDLYGSAETSGALMTGTELDFIFGRAGAHLNLEAWFQNDPENPEGTETSLVISPMLHYEVSESVVVLSAVSLGYCPGDDEPEAELDAISVGANLALDEHLELETQLDYVPGDDEVEASASVTAGLITAF